MGRFDRNNSSSGRRSGGNSFDRDRGQTTMHPAICDQCGKDCQVPFKPSGDKPIFCSSCFEQQGSGGGRDGRRDNNRRSFGESRDRGDRGNNRGDRGNRSDRGDRGDREMFSAVCDDCGKDCQVPFNPSSDKPIYCSRCFENRGNSHDTVRASNSGCNCDKQEAKLEQIMDKLDLLISALESKKTPVVKEVVKKETEKKETVKKVVKKKAVKKEPVKKETTKKTKTVKKAKKE